MSIFASLISHSKLMNSAEQFESEDWKSYVAGPLKDTKEREQKPLGGVRPDPPILPTDFKYPAFGAQQMDAFPSDTPMDLALNLPVLHRGFMPAGSEEEIAAASNHNPTELTPAQRFLEHETFSTWEEASNRWPTSAPVDSLEDADIDFNVGEAMASVSRDIPLGNVFYLQGMLGECSWRPPSRKWSLESRL